MATAAPERFQLTRWVLLCAAAETLGMTAAAAATLLGELVLPGPRTGAESAVVLLLIVVGGLVEGIALGVLQSAGLVRWLPSFSRRRWIVVTTLVAGLGWAAASAPSQFGDAADSAAPPAALVIGGGMALGALMGAVLGAAQASGLRGNVRHPWRWIWISVLAWTPAMGIIFTGATTPEAGWPLGWTLLLAAATGAAAGAALGFVSGLCWPVLQAPSWSHAFVVGVLRSRAAGLLDRSLALLHVRGAVTGRIIELPAQYAVSGDALIVLPGRPDRKRWWRNLEQPSPVDVLLRGQWRPGHGETLRPGQDGYDDALSAYRTRWPRTAAVAADSTMLVRIRLGRPSKPSLG